MKKKGCAVFAVLVMLLIFAPQAHSKEDIGELKKQLEQMTKTVEDLKGKIDSIEEAQEEENEEVEYMSDRLDKAELHAATDKLSLGVELRSKAESIHYTDMRVAPDGFVNKFFTPFDGTPSGGFDGLPSSMVGTEQLASMMNNTASQYPVEKYDADNDIAYTSKFHLNMKSRFNRNLRFSGRMAAYKVWGDSAGVKNYSGSMGDILMDGNTSSLPHGDTIRLERAYFVYSDYLKNIPFGFSLGRRPSTYGPPLEYGNYSLEQGSPLSTVINWQFDGASLNFGLEEVTGISGAALKLCYGVGFEGDWGNTYSLKNTQSDVEDVHMFGFIATLFDNDDFSAVLNYAHAWDITDGFTGLTVMPFTVTKSDSDGDGEKEYHFDQNKGGYVSRVQPSTEIGDWDAASLLLRTNLYPYIEKDIDLFLATSWSHTDPSNISANPFYEIMGQGLLSSNGDLESRDGYSIYTGALFPMPFDGRLGVEYNWGSKYWFNFTGAEDSLVGSKLATRGSVYEGYYIQPVFGENFFFKLGSRYYDYEYTGSGNPLGKPVEISQMSSLDALNPVSDKVWEAYLSATIRF